jgi:hypothetical protein
MTTIATTDPRRDPPGRDPHVSGFGTPSGPTAVSWAAILAGAAAAAALSLILILLGTGLGLSALSPWANEGASAKALGFGTGVWLIFIHLAASSLGGYIAGRLRTKWVSLHGDEVVFRDTSHGFLTWAVGTLFTAAVLTSTVSAIVGGGVRAGAQVAGGAAQAGTTAAASAGAATAAQSAQQSGLDSGPMNYMVDSLFRSPKGSKGGAAASQEQAAAEVGRIFVNALRSEKLPEEDARYAAQLVAQRTGLSQPEAERRVNDTFNQVQAKKKEAETKAREAADAARKASAATAFFLFICLLIGAFVASWAGILGGRQRDD